MAATHQQTKPELSYQQAMQTLVNDGQGGQITLAQIHGRVFHELVMRAIKGHAQERAVKDELAGLQLFYRPDRWYAACVLARYGIPLERLGAPDEGKEDGTSKS